jgi:hypothetical protein
LFPDHRQQRKQHHQWRHRRRSYDRPLRQRHNILDKDNPALNIALTEHRVVNYALGHRYDEAGFWEYHSLKNLAFYLACGLLAVLVPVYATAEGHVAA